MNKGTISIFVLSLASKTMNNTDATVLFGCERKLYARFDEGCPGSLLKMKKKVLYVDMDNALVDFVSGIEQCDENIRAEYEGKD